jgi:hypothetical protein
MGKVGFLGSSITQRKVKHEEIFFGYDRLNAPFQNADKYRICS